MPKRVVIPIVEVSWACDCGAEHRDALLHHQGCTRWYRKGKEALLVPVVESRPLPKETA